ncbi:MAG: AAA family ATPase, partial [Fusobacteriaceae bacterium]|nr:AAA family ATPase [Fusobacteriaceae bacterium]
MERLLTQDLLSWKKNRNKKPLVLFGARQTGKTYLITEFGKNYYSNIVYFNFEGSPQLADIFKKDLNPARILNELSAFSGSSILKGKTLIFFDEIQACAQALTSLKYFCEWTEQYDIIAAGSLLGIVLNRKNYSFPVGKVDLLSLYPLNFKEFLLATKNEKLIDMIATAFENDAPLSEPLHEKALDLYRIYLIVGGMPADVNEYLERKDFDYVRITQNAIYQNYIADMAKYSTPADTVKTIAVYDSIPAQLAKENKKFQYRLIKSGARASTYESAMDWLKKA